MAESDDSWEHNPIWKQDNVRLLSVGIDIGTASTQVALSRLHLQRSGVGLTSRFVVVDRETAYESAVAFTPYAADRTIDAAALGALLDDAYDAAGVRPADVDTGAVIITGEAMLKVNAARVAEAVSQHAGDFVCAAAGHHMEAMLAAHGSGAVRLSRERSARVLNVDIGGGTTKLSLVDNGSLLATAALHFGARHVVVEHGVLVGLEDAGRLIAESLGHALRLGQPVAPDLPEAVASCMADLIVGATLETADPGLAAWWLTDPIGELGVVDAVVFSGGVAEFVYGLETDGFGDLGQPLGQALRARMLTDDFPLPLWEAVERIRATVLGAAGYTVQLSGLTIYNSGLPLPRRNVPVVRPRHDAARTSEVLGSDADVAVALDWTGRPDHARLTAFATEIRDGLEDRLSRGLPLIVIVGADIALSLGRLLRDELGVTVPVLVLDGLELKDLDFIDIGRPHAISKAVPVTIKSLVFRGGTA